VLPTEERGSSEQAFSRHLVSVLHVWNLVLKQVVFVYKSVEAIDVFETIDVFEAIDAQFKPFGLSNLLSRQRRTPRRLTSKITTCFDLSPFKKRVQA